MSMKPLYVNTTSAIKLKHFTEHFSQTGWEIKPLALDIPELQTIEPEKVALAKLEIALKLTPLRPLLVDDVGLEVPSLLGFPGAFLKPVLELGGLRLLRDLLSSRLTNQSVKAQLVCAIAIDTGKKSFIRVGRMDGQLDFSNESFLDDKQTIRCFYPDGHNQSIFELQKLDNALGFQHRFKALSEVTSLLGEP